MTRATRACSVARVVVVLASALSVLALASCGSTSIDRRIADGELDLLAGRPFYRVPDPLPPGEPGQLIKSEPLLGAPDGSRAWRVMYHSRDLHDTDIAVTGVVVAPITAAIDGNRPVVSWAHPTTGTAPRCAPSAGVAPFEVIEGLGSMLAAGYVVAATDYSGMGAKGPPSYLLGETEARNVLDAARAARQVRGAGAGDRLLLWGHSQGGQAALFAGQDARSYAPDLHLEAVAVAAPAVQLAELLDDDVADGTGVALGAYSFDAYGEAYAATPGVDLASILTPAGVVATPKMAKLCLFGQAKPLHAIASSLHGHYLAGDPATTEPWASLLAQNTPGASTIGVPMLVAQGTADTLVKPATTAQYVRHLCDTGETVESILGEGLSHGTIALAVVPDVVAMFRRTLSGAPPTDTCRRS